MELKSVLGGNGLSGFGVRGGQGFVRPDHVGHEVPRKAILAASIVKGRIDQLPDETKAQIKSDFEALKAQRKDHVELTRTGAQALRSQLDAAREDGTVTEEEKAQLKADAAALRTQAQEFRKEDRASFKAFVDEVKTALKANARPPVEARPAN